MKKNLLKSIRIPFTLHLAILFLFASSNALFAQAISQDDPYITDIDIQTLETLLKHAPLEGTVESNEPTSLVDLPMPDSKPMAFLVVESPMIDDVLKERHPDVKTYAIQGVIDPTITGRLMISNRGVDATIITSSGDIQIAPVDKGSASHQVYYYTHDIPHTANDTRYYPGYTHDETKSHTHEKNFASFNIGTQIRSFNMHVIADGEYATHNCAGTMTRACVETEIMASLNGMNAFYVRDIAMKLVMTSNTTIYFDASTDPFTAAVPQWANESLTHHNHLLTNTTSDGNGGTNPIVPVASYDVGHYFSGRVQAGTGGGGVAYVGVVCLSQTFGLGGPIKSGGGTGVPAPTGASFIDLLAHEFTHQFNADHTWNGTDGFCTSDQFSTDGKAAYEPGSGSTIVSYSGICGDHNIPSPGNISYYHTISIEEVNNYINGQGNCSTNTASGNDVPVVSGATTGCTPNYNIPTQTPFEITGSATDATPANLTYCWEGFDKGTHQNPITAPTTTTQPLYRSYYPVASAKRQFPSNSILLSGNYNGDQTASALGLANWQGELLPEVARTMNLRLTVRDNNTTAGGVENTDVAINVVATGAPFKLTTPDGGQPFVAGTPSSVTWNVAGTTASPISCANVEIFLSTDGGATFPTSLGSFTNNGSAMVTIPNATPATSTARMRVQCGVDCFNFFDISNSNFSISASLPISLVAFGGQKRDESSNLLKWITDAEIDFSHFDLERSTDAQNWTSIHKVTGSGSPSATAYYDYVDQFEKADIKGLKAFYYRLKMVDLDGTYTHSSTVTISLNGHSGSIAYYPNPTKGALNIKFEGPFSNNNFELIISDVVGRQVMTRVLEVEENQQINIDLATDLAEGIYIGQVLQNGQVIDVQRIVLTK